MRKILLLLPLFSSFCMAGDYPHGPGVNKNYISSNVRQLYGNWILLSCDPYPFAARVTIGPAAVKKKASVTFIEALEMRAARLRRFPLNKQFNARIERETVFEKPLVRIAGSPWISINPKDQAALHLQYLFNDSADTAVGEFYYLSGGFTDLQLERDKGKTLDSALKSWGSLCRL
jgi:hypothetical protein